MLLGRAPVTADAQPYLSKEAAMRNAIVAAVNALPASDSLNRARTGIWLVVTSPQLSFDDYTSQGISRDDVIHIMVGDLQRLSVYANKGFSTLQEIPPDVASAYEGLVAAGYTKRLLGSE